MQQVLLVTVLVVQLGMIALIIYKSKKLAPSPNTETYDLLEDVYKSVQGLLESQRLSTILRLEPASLKISPEDFAPNRERLKSLLIEGYHRETHTHPETLAYCILNHGGFDSFVTAETRQATQRALARLLVNGKPKKIQAFLEELADKL